jgi:hypothetical protein
LVVPAVANLELPVHAAFVGALWWHSGMARAKVAFRTQESGAGGLRSSRPRTSGRRGIIRIGGSSGAGARRGCGMWMLELGSIGCAVHVGGRWSVRGKRVRVGVAAGKRQVVGCSHYELRRAMTVLEEPIAGGLLGAQ